MWRNVYLQKRFDRPSKQGVWHWNWLEVFTEVGMNKHKLDVCFKFCCNDCGKMFKRASILEKHRKIHSDKPKELFNCDQCGKDFSTQGALKRHKILHSNMMQFQCYCGRAFNRKDNFRSHQKTHQSPKPGIAETHSEEKSVLASSQGFTDREAWQKQQQHLSWFQSGPGLSGI